MTKLHLLPIALLAGSLLASVAKAEDRTPCVPAALATAQSTCVAVTRDATTGIWLSLPRAVDVLALAAEAEATSQALDERKAQAAAQAAALDERKAEAEALKVAVAKTEARALADEAAITESKRWYRSPWFWTSVGVTMGSMAGCKLAGGETLPCLALPGGGGAALISLSIVLH